MAGTGGQLADAHTCACQLRPVERVRQVSGQCVRVRKLLRDREDGSFTVEHVPVGSSYIVEIASTEYLFESVRVDVSTKGKLRARRLNLLQPAQVTQVSTGLLRTHTHRCRIRCASRHVIRSLTFDGAKSGA
jgi:hypothetical protein